MRHSSTVCTLHDSTVGGRSWLLMAPIELAAIKSQGDQFTTTQEPAPRTNRILYGVLRSQINAEIVK